MGSLPIQSEAINLMFSCFRFDICFRGQDACDPPLQWRARPYLLIIALHNDTLSIRIILFQVIVITALVRYCTLHFPGNLLLYRYYIPRNSEEHNLTEHRAQNILLRSIAKLVSMLP